jgi:DNA-binding transcriptional ArsR family regulator
MIDKAWQPAPIGVVDSAAAIKALADPLRLRVLQLLMTTSHRSWSVKEIAGELGQPITKLYHHVKLLEGAALITDVESRLVSGIVEHRYRASQKTLRFDDSLFCKPETRSASIDQVAALVDTSRDDLLDYLNSDDADIDLVSVSKATARLSPEEIESVVKAIDELIAGFARTRDEKDRARIPHSAMLFVVHPLAHDPE